MVPKHLKSLMSESVVKDYNGSKRRYFRIYGTDRNGVDELRQISYILFGTTNYATLTQGVFSSMHNKVEEFDGKFWVRTTIGV